MSIEMNRMPAGIRRSIPETAVTRPNRLTSPRVAITSVTASAPPTARRRPAPAPRARRYPPAGRSPAPAAHRQRQQRRPDPDRPPARHLDRHAARRGGTVEHPPGDPPADGHEHEPRQPRPVDADAGQLLAGELDARAAGEPRGRVGRVEHAQRAARTRLLPGGRGGTSAASSGARNVTSCIVLISSGISGVLRGATSTCSGRPVGGSAHTSTRPTVVSASAGVSRSPAAARPAIRRAGSGVTGSSGARRRRRLPSSGGSRSAARGSRSAAFPDSAVSWSNPKSQTYSRRSRW